MAPEDKYSAGLAAGAGLGAAGALTTAAGSRIRREGRLKARANAGSRGERVRGGRLVRAGRDQVAEGNQGLSQFKRVQGKDGKTRYMNPTGGGFATVKPFTDLQAAGKQTVERGGSMIRSAGFKRQNALSGLKAMRKGKLVARGGAAAAVAGGALAVGSVAAGERYRSKRVRQIDGALRPKAAPAARPAQDYRAMRSEGGLLTMNGYPVKVSPRAASDWLREAERGAR